MTGTSLVGDKLIQINKTQRSIFYMIKRTHLANINREKRKQRRNEDTNTIKRIQKQPATKQNDAKAIKGNNQYASLNSDDNDSATIILMVPETVESAIHHHGIMYDADEDNDTTIATNFEGISQSILDMSHQFQHTADNGIEQIHVDIMQQ